MNRLDVQLMCNICSAREHAGDELRWEVGHACPVCLVRFDQGDGHVIGRVCAWRRRSPFDSLPEGEGRIGVDAGYGHLPTNRHKEAL